VERSRAMTMFVRDVWKAVKKYCFNDWGVDKKKGQDLAEYRRIEHLDDPTYYKRTRGN